MYICCVNFIYNIGLRGYQLLVFIASFFVPKAKLWREGRQDWKSKLELLRGQKVIWIHAASLGEFEQGKPIIDQLYDENNGCKILLTFFSPSGYEVRKNYDKADLVMYLPLDTTRNAKYFITQLDLEMAIFIKYEFWFNFLNQLHLKNIKTVFISVIFRADQMFFSWWGKWFLNHLKNISQFFVQNKESESLLITNDISAVEIVGDTRFDSVCETQKDAKKDALIESFLGDNTCIVFGSTWKQDHDLIISYINSRSECNVKYIIAPHEMDESELERLSHLINKKVVNYLDNNSEGEVMVVNTIGILKHLYQYSLVSYIGGGFGTGIHNTLEAAVQNQYVVFGPKYQKFQEAIDLIEHGIGASISSQIEMDKILTKVMSDGDFRKEVEVKSKLFIEQNRGASTKILEFIYKQLH